MSRRRTLVALAVAAWTTFIACLVPFAQPASAVPVGGEAAYGYSGTTGQYVVPDGTSSLTVVVAGGAGTTGYATGVVPGLVRAWDFPLLYGGDDTTDAPGAGGLTRAVIHVTPGQVLTIKVGGTGLLTAGGWPDGGAAGRGYTDPFLSSHCCGGGVDGGGGGGSSSIWLGSTPLVVAGGGGGSGGGGSLSDTCQGFVPPLVQVWPRPIGPFAYPPCGGTWTVGGNGGNGGANSDGSGTRGFCGTGCQAGEGGGPGGGGGTPSGGGAGGIGDQAASGTSGGFASGGAGGSADSFNTGSGGGGAGGGYYGGGGGAAAWYRVCTCNYYPFGPTGGGGGGGGGGASYVIPTGEQVSFSSGPAAGPGFVQITPTAVGGT